MKSFPLELLRSQLDKANSERNSPGLSLHLDGVERGEPKLRVDLTGGEKRIFPVEWCEEPVTPDAWENHPFLAPQTVILSPVISNRQARVYRDVLGANHADLNGRLFLNAGSLLIDRDPVLRHKPADFGFGRSDDSLFSPKATRVLRHLLAQPHRIWLQAELQEEAGVSRGYVSRLLQTLLGQGFVRKEGLGGRTGPACYYLTDAPRLLDEWAKADHFDRRVRIQRYSTLESDPAQVAAYANERLGDSPHAFTQWFAAWLRRPHTTPPLVSVYVPEKILAGFDPGRRVDAGGNLHLLVPEDEGVFQCLRDVQGLPLVCDAQVYLDLISQGQRGPEAANALRQWEGFGRDEN
jgi:hypothetical protein